MTSVSVSRPVAGLTGAVTVRSDSLNRYFSVFRDGEAVYQSEYELTADGAEVFRNTQKLEYAIGSGANGFTYLVRRGSLLLQAPLSYYSRVEKWALSPGYETEDIGFSRPVPGGCVVCHSGRPQPLSSQPGAYRDPPFQELAIGCENCHGPGALHVAERSNGKPQPAKVGRSIVNPAKLTPWLADNICMYCHQGSTTRVLQPGKNYDDFRPGTPLDETMAIFAPALNPSPTDSPLLEHYTLMTMSRCYDASPGRMGCATCHDPHEEPDRKQAAAYFRNKCLGCHTERGCKLPLAARGVDDCAACHMPKRDVDKIAHSVLTSHRIVRKPGQPAPAPRVTPQLPDLVHVSRVPGTNREVPPITVLQAYRELAASQAEYQLRYGLLLDQVAKTNPKDPLVLSGLAYRKLAAPTPAAKIEALRLLGDAIDAGARSVQDFETLAGLLSESGRLNEASEMLERAINADPFHKRSYKALALTYITQRRYDDALSTMRRHLAVFPEDSFMRSLLKQVENRR